MKTVKYTGTNNFGTIIDLSVTQSPGIGTVSVSTVQNLFSSWGVTPYSKITSATLSMKMKVSLTGRPYTISVGGTTVASGEVTATSKTYSANITTHILSGIGEVPKPNGDIVVFINSSTVGSSKHCDDFTLNWNWEHEIYTVSVIADDGGTATGGGIDTFRYGDTTTIKATANAGYKFVKWNDGDTNATRTVTVTGDATYIAYFEEKPPEITSVEMLYSDKQISSTNKVTAGQGFVVRVGVQA